MSPPPQTMPSSRPGEGGAYSSGTTRSSGTASRQQRQREAGAGNRAAAAGMVPPARAQKVLAAARRRLEEGHGMAGRPLRVQLTQPKRDQVGRLLGTSRRDARNERAAAAQVPDQRRRASPGRGGLAVVARPPGRRLGAAPSPGCRVREGLAVVLCRTVHSSFPWPPDHSTAAGWRSLRPIRWTEQVTFQR